MSVKEKFLDYVSYDTQSDSSSTTMPSTMKQKLLAQHLADEMVAMGIEDAHMDEWGYVYGTIPANCEKKNVVGFIAHMDTAEEVSGANVKARVIENYDSEDIVLNKELGIVTDVENFPILKKIIGIGFPSALQQVLTCFSNVYVQSYVNAFGSSCMAGWSACNKTDSFIMLPVSSLSMAITTFVGQNTGADKPERAREGVRTSM